MANDRRGLIGLPLCCVVACGMAALLIPVHLLNWVVLAVFAWQFHHFQKQNLGLVALAASFGRAAWASSDSSGDSSCSPASVALPRC